MKNTQSPRRAKLRWSAGFAGIAAVGLFVAACGSSGGSGYGKAGSATSGTAPTTTMPTTPVTLAAGTSNLGQVVVDANGKTLYRFDKDVTGSGTSACNGACAAMWPAALVSGQPTAAPGLTGILGAITRVDASRQVTLDGHPLYRYAGDKAAGDTFGDGIGGIWHAVRASDASAPSVAATPAGY